MIKEKYTGTGNVVLIAGGGKVFTDIAARFVGSERSLEDIIASPYSKEIVENILKSGHKAALEFDDFIFGVEGYSRATETQLVRKRIASYLIKSGRCELKGKRTYSIVYPESIKDIETEVSIPASALSLPNGDPFEGRLDGVHVMHMKLTTQDLINFSSQWYDSGLELGYKEEDLRYLKPQATEFKAIVKMNAHALHDWFSIRCCQNAQHEIRDLAHKMLTLCKNATPDLFKGAGPSCQQLGYCPENYRQNEKCRGKILTKDSALAILEKYKGEAA